MSAVDKGLPLQVIDSDLEQVDEALAQMGQVLAPAVDAPEEVRPAAQLSGDAPDNIPDLIEFLRRAAVMVRQRQAPVPAAMLEATANVLEKVFSRR